MVKLSPEMKEDLTNAFVSLRTPLEMQISQQQNHKPKNNQCEILTTRLSKIYFLKCNHFIID